MEEFLLLVAALYAQSGHMKLRRVTGTGPQYKTIQTTRYLHQLGSVHVYLAKVESFLEIIYIS